MPELDVPALSAGSAGDMGSRPHDSSPGIKKIKGRHCLLRFMRPCNLNPKENCGFCPRLAAFREANRIQYPGWHHAPVPSFGPLEAELLMVGLAPG